MWFHFYFPLKFPFPVLLGLLVNNWAASRYNWNDPDYKSFIFERWLFLQLFPSIVRDIMNSKQNYNIKILTNQWCSLRKTNLNNIQDHSLKKKHGHDVIDIADPSSIEDTCYIWTSWWALLTIESSCSVVGQRSADSIFFLSPALMTRRKNIFRWKLFYEPYISYLQWKWNASSGQTSRNR